MNTKRNSDSIDSLVKGTAWVILPSLWVLVVLIISFPKITFTYFSPMPELDKTISESFKQHYMISAYAVLVLMALEAVFVLSSKGKDIFEIKINGLYTLTGFVLLLAYGIMVISIFFNANNGGVEKGFPFHTLFNWMVFILVLLKYLFQFSKIRLSKA